MGRNNKEGLSIKEEIKKIFLLRIDRLGDLILSIPAIKCIRQNFPSSHIKLLVDSKFTELVDIKENVNEVIGFDRRIKLNPVKFISLMRGLRKEKYDIAIDLMTISDNISSLVLYFLKSKRKCGYSVGLRKYVSDLKIDIYDNLKYETELVLDILRKLGLKVEYAESSLKFTEDDEKKIFAWFEKCNISRKDTIIGIHPGVSRLRPGKAWQPEKFAQLGKKLEEKYNAKIVLTGTSDEQELLERVNRLSGGRFYISAGCFNLSGLVALISKFKLFIVNNTGPMHIAMKNKVPSVIITGFSNMTRWSANKCAYKAVQKNYDCIPCEGKHKECITGDYRCIKNITVEEAYSASCELLKAVDR